MIDNKVDISLLVSDHEMIILDVYTPHLEWDLNDFHFFFVTFSFFVIAQVKK